jgi:cytochrome c-type biogenesis protein CcsB
MNYAILEENLVSGTFLASLISFVLFLISIVTKRNNSEKSQITSILGYISMIFAGITSTIALFAKWKASGHVPWSNFYESMVLMTTLAIFLFLYVYKKYKNDILGVVMSPGIVILIGIASILPKNFKGNEPLVPALQSYWIKIHTTSMIVSYSVFLLATTTAIAYLVLYFLVSRKENVKKVSLASTGPKVEQNISFSSNENKPSRINNDTHKGNSNLMFFDDITYRLILLGFPILAFGIITGAMWANHAWGNYWSWDPKETASLMSWLFYGAYIHTRVGMNIKGKNSAIIAILAFASIIFTYYGVNFLPGLHSYGFSVE